MKRRFFMATSVRDENTEKGSIKVYYIVEMMSNTVNTDSNGNAVCLINCNVGYISEADKTAELSVEKISNGSIRSIIQKSNNQSFVMNLKDVKLLDMTGKTYANQSEMQNDIDSYYLGTFLNSNCSYGVKEWKELK